MKDNNMLNELLDEQRNAIEFGFKEKAKRWLRHFESKYPGYNLKTLKPIIDHGSFGVIIDFKSILGKNFEEISEFEKLNINKVDLHYTWIKYFFGVE